MLYQQDLVNVLWITYKLLMFQINKKNSCAFYAIHSINAHFDNWHWLTLDSGWNPFALNMIIVGKYTRCDLFDGSLVSLSISASLKLDGTNDAFSSYIAHYLQTCKQKQVWRLGMNFSYDKTRPSIPDQREIEPYDRRMREWDHSRLAEVNIINQPYPTLKWDVQSCPQRQTVLQGNNMEF